MSALAIDMRPTRWSEVIGQDTIVSSIKKKLKSGVPPAWLFIGPSGSGKTTISEILAREIQGNIDEENIPFLTIQRLNAADKNGVEDARQLAEESRRKPTQGRYRVFILDEAHMLTVPAQNALLIPTESKDSPTVWIFCTTDPSKLLPTLRSRCITYELKPFGKEDIRTLIQNAAKETGSVSEALNFIEEVFKKSLTNPREILYAWEKYAAGVPLEEAISPPPDADPVYTDIAKAAVRGDWAKTKLLLQGMKSADTKGLKSVLSWFFRSELLNSLDGRADSLSEALIRLGNLNSFEDGVTFSAIVGILYHHARKTSKQQIL